jgi:23S rRNA (cytosine1962-C5)-methyltransferase
VIIELFKSANRKRLELRPGRERAVSNRHPWIFAGAIARESGPDEAAIADLVDARGNVLASGLHSKRSQIRLRALTFGDEELTPDLIRDRIASAISQRRSLLDDATNAARLVNAEGDDLSGLVIDRYDDLIVIEISNYGLEQIKPLITEMFDGPIFFKNDLPARKIEGLTLESEGRTPSSAQPRDRGRTRASAPPLRFARVVSASSSSRAKGRRPASSSINARTAGLRARSPTTVAC